MHDFLLNLISWITNHPNQAGLAVFFASFAESLAFVGLVIPGAALMLGAGALIAAGALSFWPTMAWAICGAVLGDGLSFWFGHHFKQRIYSFSLFVRFPSMLVRGEQFFHRHGGKSVFLGRFVGPIRPVIPLVAGMLGMERKRFTLYNALSALAWAPAYLLPGMAFGASLALAGEVAGRLALLLVVLLALIWLIFSLFRRGFLVLLIHWSAWEKKLITLVNRSPLLQQWLGGFFDKNASLLRPLIALVCFFVGATWLFFGITEDVVNGDPLVQSGKSLYHLLQGLRTPWGDTLMVGITMLGDAVVTVSVTLAVLFWLLVKKDRYSALFLTGVTLTGFLLVTVVKYVTKIPRPIEMYGGAVHWAFPSSHATMSLVTYGFLALLCSRKLPVRRRWLPFAVSLFLILGIGFSRLYLGAHWLSDVIGGFSLGSAWLIIMTICYLHGRRPWTSHGLFLYFLAVFVLAATVHWSTGFADNLIRYRQLHTTVRMSTASWLDHGWRQLPAYRLDLGGEKEQTLNLQYAGTLPQLSRLLEKSGWTRPIPLTPATSLRWLMADPGVLDLPVLPQVNDGRNEFLLLIHTLPDKKNDFFALRLWPADVSLYNSIPLWLGTLTRMTVRCYMKLICLPRTTGTIPPAPLLLDLTGTETFLKQTDQRTVLLVRTRGELMENSPVSTNIRK